MRGGLHVEISVLPAIFQSRVFVGQANLETFPLRDVSKVSMGQLLGTFFSRSQ